ncbi:MAG: acetate--CoA ligase family protein, partial [Alphaproteobacteria bacterium]|nr:acetate--CoA ligase family protein [Alphaproteobacteria bacterium]
MDAKTLIAHARSDGRGSLDEEAGKQILAACGIAVPRSVVLTNDDDIEGALQDLSFPVVAKVMSSEILHKSDAGGVQVNLVSADAVREAVETMAQAPGIKGKKVDGYLIEEMAPPGQEIVIGGVRDPQFGPLVMVGLGGVFVEVLADVAFRICPISESDARGMLDELRGAPLLDGVRGGEPVSRDALVDVLLKVGGADGILMQLRDEVAELDVNPLIVSRDGAVAVDARFILTPDDKAPADDSSTVPAKDFEHLFAPKAVAVVGASASGVTIANTFIGRMQRFGYDGPIYPIHPSAPEVEGLTAYPSFADMPAPADYCYIAVGAARVPEILESMDGRVRFAQVISSGFGEVSHGVSLEGDLVAGARKGGCRVLGPNCLGMYSPRGKLTFPDDAPRTVGHVGVISQSGGLGTDIITRGERRGIRFSGLVTVGNSADLGPNDLLEFYLDDAQTRVVGMYVEGVRDGRRLFDVLRANDGAKPVVILKGGRTQKGLAAAASHTGALAGDDRVWVALSKQTGCVLVDTLEEFLDVLLGFQELTPRADRATKHVAMFGNGGGTSVLATDFFYRHGLDIDPFNDATVAALEALQLPPGTSIVNPVDAPVGTMQQEEGRIAEKILDAVYTHASPNALVMHLNL